MLGAKEARTLVEPYTVEEVETLIREAAKNEHSVELHDEKLSVETLGVILRHGFKVEPKGSIVRVSW